MVGQIGEGAFGLVHYARGPNNRVCAIKTFKTTPKDPPVVPAPTIREVFLLTDLKHENVLNLLHVQVNHNEQALSLVFDYAEYDLHRLIRHHKEVLRHKPIGVRAMTWAQPPRNFVVFAVGGGDVVFLKSGSPGILGP